MFSPANFFWQVFRDTWPNEVVDPRREDSKGGRVKPSEQPHLFVCIHRTHSAPPIQSPVQIPDDPIACSNPGKSSRLFKSRKIHSHTQIPENTCLSEPLITHSPVHLPVTPFVIIHSYARRTAPIRRMLRPPSSESPATHSPVH